MKTQFDVCGRLRGKLDTGLKAFMPLMSVYIYRAYITPSFFGAIAAQRQLNVSCFWSSSEFIYTPGELRDMREHGGNRTRYIV